MRITSQYTYQNSLNSYKTGQETIEKYNQQFQTGQVIQNGWEDPSVSINNGRLDFEANTVAQVTKATQSASEMAKNTDSTMKQIVKDLTRFKTKLLQAVNGGNDETSRMAIVNELKEIKKGIVNMANTSVNGQYLFSGSDLSTKPFDYEGNYNGNNEHIYVKTGAGTKAPYNIPGFDLFFSSDNDYEKLITSNVSLKDNRFPDTEPDKNVVLGPDAKFKDLIGQNYTKAKDLDPVKDFEYEGSMLDFPPSALFVQGVKPDGSSFRASIFVDSEGSVGDMLDQIGALYGNTADKKVVDLSLNASGQIEIKNLDAGDKMLEFHASAMNLQTNTEQDYKNILDAAAAENPPLSPTGLMNRVLANVFNLNGNNNDVIHTQNMPNPPYQIQVNGQDFEVDLNQTAFIKSKMTDQGGNPTDGMDYDNVYFNHEGNTLTSNSPQVVRKTNTFATLETKLSDVIANDTLAGAKLNMNITSKAGINYTIDFDIASSSVSYRPNPNGGNNAVTFPITNETFNPANNTSSARRTQPGDITYKQLSNIIGMFATDNQPKTNINIQPNGTLSNQDMQTLRTGSSNANALVEVGLNRGKLELFDKYSNNTDIKLAISAPPLRPGPGPALVAGDFPPMGTTDAKGSNFVFNANNALVIDEPSVSLIDDLQKMIDAVASGQVRADANSDDPRNTGMQGGIKRIDHLIDHINKQHTKIGAYQNSIDNTNERSTFLEVNVKSIQNDVIGADLAESFYKLTQATMDFQAALMASSKISQISLLNYM